MSDVSEETPPQPTPTPVKRGVSLASRLLLGQIRLPTWSFFVLAIIVGVPDWNSRIQFWLQAAKSSGGLLGAMATALLWPYASVVIAGLGLLSLLAFEVRDRKLAGNTPSVAFAWASLAVCTAAVGSTAVYGYVQVYIKREVAAGIAGLPRNVPNLADPNRTQKPLSTASRQLQPDQQRVLLQMLPKLKPLLPSITFMYDASDYEPISVAQGYQKVFARSGISTSNQYRQPSGPDDTGIRILVADVRNITEAAQVLKRDLELADVTTTFEQYAAVPTSQQNYPICLYFAPAPLL